MIYTYIMNNINLDIVKLLFKDSIHHLPSAFSFHFQISTARDKISGYKNLLYLVTLHIEPNTSTFSTHFLVK
jgi:hypothetical protein